MNIEKVSLEDGLRIILISAGVISVIMSGFFFFYYKNKAINAEERVYESLSNIETIQQQRVDSLSMLVDAVKDSKEFEVGVMKELLMAQNAAEVGDLKRSNEVLVLAAKDFPKLETVSLYENLMHTASSIENRMNTARISYNRNVREYNKIFRRFPSDVIVRIAGIEKQEFPLFDSTSHAKNFDPAYDSLWKGE